MTAVNKQDMEQALKRGEFRMLYQPKFDLQDNRVSGAEALVRWQRSSGEILSPNSFIPLAESCGFIEPLGQFVLSEACQQAKRWQDSGLELSVAVNLSAVQFRSPSLIRQVEDALGNAGLAPHLLELEITESMAIDNIDEVVAILDDLSAAGVHIAIDDFGTGYSNLRYLQRFKISTLKIDRAFIASIDGVGYGGEIAAAIIGIAHSLDLDTVAEGVETHDQVAFLRQLWTDQVQGFLISKPIPGDQLADQIHSRVRHRRETMTNPRKPTPKEPANDNVAWPEVVDPDEADRMGAFREDALDPDDALDSLLDGDDPTAFEGDDAGGDHD